MSLSDLPGAAPDPAHGPAAGQLRAGALAEPERAVRPVWIAGVVLVNLGINAAFFAPLQVLLGQQAATFSEADKEAILALVTGAGAAVSLVANPLFGAFSDRTSARMGRRVPWVLFGAILGAVALIALAGAPNVASMTLIWCLVQAGCNGAYAAITAAIPDRVPVAQRGTVGGLAAMGQTVGILAGAVIAAAVTGNFAVGYLVCAVALLAGVVLYFFRSDDVPLPAEVRPPFRLADFATGFWISPVLYPDFGWAWLTRLLVNIGNHMITLYLLFFLTDAVQLEQTQGIPPELGVLVLTGLYAVMVIISSVIGGRISDRMGKRKPLVIISSLIIAAAALILAFAPSWTGALLGASVLGLGFGCYLAVDFALITQVLPAARSRGRDLGVLNIANSLPQVLAPLIAFPFVTMWGGYVSLFVAAAVIGLLGAVFVVKIKGVD
ncbi:MFS transporter [Arthrobacter sp. AL08]|uniref:MFS transporter n=1 Tax=Micrococcaceae TaxID=1268 RepID=UPI00249B4995|nr:MULTISPECIES: MFS transporter [Micrococcaceae]MDI3241947.1 MFS transporter [Arthrobacter sp. AL05]MDI3278113.1 MFS transporter [Arthrobacter sp. AL08]MDJ0354202.1 MFS transporter [Pseudarthrobacter sp. PH31-O2]